MTCYQKKIDGLFGIFPRELSIFSGNAPEFIYIHRPPCMNLCYILLPSVSAEFLDIRHDTEQLYDVIEIVRCTFDMDSTCYENENAIRYSISSAESVVGGVEAASLDDQSLLTMI